MPKYKLIRYEKKEGFAPPKPTEESIVEIPIGYPVPPSAEPVDEATPLHDWQPIVAETPSVPAEAPSAVAESEEN